ncbi:Glycosyltransferase Family 25 protein [Gigaspora rosea]|uniref:Glycosyltransferase Family 25 protein n=1 Tax=Gigaspora rosea TaxID=44941 RepID=A0A397TYJ0_9GLOM|nr:Glycosyltransferase Family 25 protein [Gigaspora rosea]
MQSLEKRVGPFVGVLFILILIYNSFVFLEFLNPFIHFDIQSNKPNYTRTLGFEHIYVINLDYRIDRYKKMKVLGNFLDLDFDIIKAVSKYDSEALSRLNRSDLNVGAKAYYLSHYLTYELIAENEYENALILEDAVDIELNITDIMTEVHRYLPDDWDILYLGHCADTQSQYFETDLTVHVLHKTGVPRCTHGYAVSAKGVKKLLEKLDIDNPQYHIDQDLPSLIHQNEIISYSVFPHIIQFKGVSDLSDVSPGTLGETYHLMNSTLRFLGYNTNIYY